MKEFDANVGDIYSELMVTVSVSKEQLKEMKRLYDNAAEENKPGERYANLPIEFEHDGCTYKGGIAVINRNDLEWPLLNVVIDKWKPEQTEYPEARYSLSEIDDWEGRGDYPFNSETDYTLEDEFCNRLILHLEEN